MHNWELISDRKVTCPLCEAVIDGIVDNPPVTGNPRGLCMYFCYDLCEYYF